MLISTKQARLARAVAKHDREMTGPEFRVWLKDNGFDLGRLNMDEFDAFLTALRNAPKGSRMHPDAVQARELAAQNRNDLRRWIRQQRSAYGEHDFREHGGR